MGAIASINANHQAVEHRHLRPQIPSFAGRDVLLIAEAAFELNEQ